jgi:hypothetical protein
VEPRTQDEKIILKDKFLIRSNPNIHRKLQKLAAEPCKSLDQLVQAATAIFYDRDLEEERRKDKCQEALQWLCRTTSGAGPNCGLASFVDRKAIIGGSAPGGKGHLWDPVLSVNKTTGRLNASHTK